MVRKGVRVLAASAFAALLGVAVLWAQASLGTAQAFAVLGGSTVTNTGATVVEGELGVSPGYGRDRVPAGIVVGGTIHTGDAVAAQAQVDVTTQYNALAGTPCTADLTGQDLGGMVLTPGVYCFSTSAQLTGPLVLDAQGNFAAVYFQDRKHADDRQRSVGSR